MLFLSIEAETLQQLRSKALVALDLSYLSVQGGIPASAPAPEAVVATTAPAAEELKQKRTRKVTQAPDPVAQQAEQLAVVTDSQAQVDNSASAPLVIPAEAKVPEKGEDTEASTPVSSPATVTFDDMKAKLQAVSARFPGDEGLAKVSGIIAEFGARKVKEVPADKFADVVAKCEEILK